MRIAMINCLGLSPGSLVKYYTNLFSDQIVPNGFVQLFPK